MNSSFNNTKPIYLQIIEKIEIEIISGARSPGERIESVRELATKLKVNPNTIQRALSELETKKLVETERTNGRFVTKNEAKLKKLKEKYDTAFVFAADEFYITAEREIPPAEAYEDFPQIENGVGMLALTMSEADEELESIGGYNKEKHVSLVTGEAAYKFIKAIAEKVENKFPCVKIDVHCIKNNFFGGYITVSGLLTGTDIIDQLKGKELGEYLVLPKNLLRSGETTLLDDLTVEDIEKALGVDVKIADENGSSLIMTILG